MSKKIIMVGVGLLGAVSLLAVSAVAGQKMGDGHGWKRGHGGGHHGGYYGGKHEGGKHGMLRNLKSRDADSDGKVTLDEFLKPRRDEFTKRDANSDGKLVGDEIASPVSERGEYRMRRLQKRFDADGDGNISKAEFEAVVKARFAERDFDGDGKIADDEMPPRRRGKWQDNDDAPEGADNSPSDEAGVEGAPEGAGNDEYAGRGERGEGKAHHGKRYGKGHHGKRHGKGHHRKGGWRHGKRGRGGQQGWQNVRSLEEALERSGKRFAMLDKDGDGVVVPSEMNGSDSERAAYWIKRMTHVLDADKDGAISGEEFVAKARKRFDMADLNSDGVIDEKDLPPRAAKAWTGSR